MNRKIKIQEQVFKILNEDVPVTSLPLDVLRSLGMYRGLMTPAQYGRLTSPIGSIIDRLSGNALTPWKEKATQFGLKQLHGKRFDKLELLQKMLSKTQWTSDLPYIDKAAERAAFYRSYPKSASTIARLERLNSRWPFTRENIPRSVILKKQRLIQARKDTIMDPRGNNFLDPKSLRDQRLKKIADAAFERELRQSKTGLGLNDYINRKFYKNADKVNDAILKRTSSTASSMGQGKPLTTKPSLGRGLAGGIGGLGAGIAADYLTGKALDAAGVENETARDVVGTLASNTVGGAVGTALAGLGAGAGAAAGAVSGIGSLAGWYAARGILKVADEITGSDLSQQKTNPFEIYSDYKRDQERDKEVEEAETDRLARLHSPEGQRRREEMKAILGPKKPVEPLDQRKFYQPNPIQGFI